MLADVNIKGVFRSLPNIYDGAFQLGSFIINFEYVIEFVLGYFFLTLDYKHNKSRKQILKKNIPKLA